MGLTHQKKRCIYLRTHIKDVDLLKALEVKLKANDLNELIQCFSKHPTEYGTWLKVFLKLELKDTYRNLLYLSKRAIQLLKSSHFSNIQNQSDSNTKSDSNIEVQSQTVECERKVCESFERALISEVRDLDKQSFTNLITAANDADINYNNDVNDHDDDHDDDNDDDDNGEDDDDNNNDRDEDDDDDNIN